MKIEHLVSVIIYCNQNDACLNRALKSVMEQTYRHVEVIVAGIFHQPQSADMDSSALPVTFIHQTYQNAGEALNAGLKAAGGSLIKFINAEDELLPDCLLDQVYDMDSGVFSYIGYREADENNEGDADVISAFGNPLHDALMVSPGPLQCFLFSARDLLSVDGFDESFSDDFAMSTYDLLLRLLIKGTCLAACHKAGVILRPGKLADAQTEAVRLSVWTQNVQMLLNRAEMSQETLHAIFTGFCQLKRISQDTTADQFSECGLLLANYVNSNPHHFAGFRFTPVIRELAVFEGNDTLINALSECNRELLAYSGFWEPQEIIDYRSSLLSASADFRDDYLTALFVLLNENQGKKIAVYGAGELGQRLISIIESAGFNVATIFDRNWDKIKLIGGIPVQNPEDISMSDVQIVIIASVAYRREISDFLRMQFPFVISF